jgi:acetoin utilization deacetylase AcuC-like enzyme
VLDVDFHHGNGTQDIFRARGDVLFASIHGDPLDAFPYYTGFADETGEGAGEGATINHPLPPGTPYGPWSEALDDALRRIADWGAEALVLSLGVDAFREDPISFFRLASEDFLDMGARVGRTGLPVAACLEGGYAVDAVGINVVNALEGILGA